MSNKVHMALCFFNEDDELVAKKDLNVSWNLGEHKEQSPLQEVLVLDEVSDLLNYELQSFLKAHIRELLDIVKGTK